MQGSVRLHGRGGSAVPSSYEQRTEEMRSISAIYSLRSIYNMDESGLFYRMGPGTSYFSPAKEARTIRGTELQK